MKRAQRAALAAASGIVLAIAAPTFGASAWASEIAGDYTRPNGDKARVSVSSGKLYCKIVSGAKAGFEMCHGMDKTGAEKWQGGAMKHPSMPGMMSFNGTVTQTASGLSIKGCAVGQSMCDAENWTRD